MDQKLIQQIMNKLVKWEISCLKIVILNPLPIMHSQHHFDGKITVDIGHGYEFCIFRLQFERLLMLPKTPPGLIVEGDSIGKSRLLSR